MSKTMSLWQYINYYDTDLCKNFKEYFLLQKLPKQCISSKKFLQIYMNDSNNIFQTQLLKNLYNQYYETIMAN